MIRDTKDLIKFGAGMAIMGVGAGMWFTGKMLELVNDRIEGDRKDDRRKKELLNKIHKIKEEIDNSEGNSDKLDRLTKEFIEVNREYIELF